MNKKDLFYQKIVDRLVEPLFYNLEVFGLSPQEKTKILSLYYNEDVNVFDGGVYNRNNKILYEESFVDGYWYKKN